MKYILTLILSLLTALPTLAQGVKFTANAPLSVQEGARFNIKFVLENAEASTITTPEATGIQMLAGPQIANGSYTEMSNGRTVHTTSQTFTYTYQANKAGIAKIGRVTVEVSGKKYTSKPISIEILAQGQRAKNNGIQASDVILRLNLSKSKLYKGEALLATMKLYTRVEILNINNVKMPRFTNFWSEQLKANNTPTRETINKKSYQAHTISQWLLFPQKNGKIRIEAATLSAVAQIELQGSQNNDLYGVFMGGREVERIELKLKTNPLTISVLDLPQPQPANFNGAIGEFTMTSEISANSFAANDAGSIKLKLKGRGNFPLITAPKSGIPPAFESYDTKTTDNITNSSSGSSGTINWEYPFIARAEGSYEIPAIEFTFFDPKTKKYETLSSGNMPVEITKSSSQPSQSGAFISGVSKEDLQMLGQDIQFIKLGLKSAQPIGRTLMWSGTFFGSIALIIALFFASMFMMRKLIAQQKDITHTKNKKANKVALRRLKKAKSHMIAQDSEMFYDEMLKALWGYMGDKLAIEISDLTKDNVSARLQLKGVNPTKIEALMNLVATCEEAQYAPSQAAPTENTYNEALEIIGNMEIK